MQVLPMSRCLALDYNFAPLTSPGRMQNLLSLRKLHQPLQHAFDELRMHPLMRTLPFLRSMRTVPRLRTDTNSSQFLELFGTGKLQVAGPRRTNASFLK